MISSKQSFKICLPKTPICLPSRMCFRLDTDIDRLSAFLKATDCCLQSKFPLLFHLRDKS